MNTPAYECTYSSFYERIDENDFQPSIFLPYLGRGENLKFYNQFCNTISDRSNAIRLIFLWISKFQSLVGNFRKRPKNLYNEYGVTRINSDWKFILRWIKLQREFYSIRIRLRFRTNFPRSGLSTYSIILSFSSSKIFLAMLGRKVLRKQLKFFTLKIFQYFSIFLLKIVNSFHKFTMHLSIENDIDLLVLINFSRSNDCST